MGPKLWELVEPIKGWMHREACDWLARLAVKSRSWTEIGSYCGRSTMAVGLHLPSGSLLQLVDKDFQPEFFDTIKTLRRLKPHLRIVICNMDSMEASTFLQPTDVGFIDGNHEYSYVRQDFLCWQGKCRILCGHDYVNDWPGVMRAVKELCPRFQVKAKVIWVRA